VDRRGYELLKEMAQISAGIELSCPPVYQRSIPGYSARRASTGFTDAARRAGTKAAAIDASPSNKATKLRVGASHACTPNNRLRMSSDAPTEPTSPIASPAPISQPACRITSA